MFKNTVFKKTLILTALASLFIVGCSNDQTYKREIEGNDDYLNSPALKPLANPNGVTLPTETSEYYIYTSTTEGALGKNVDIRPPLLPIPTIADAYATYDRGAVTLDAPAYSAVWDSIPSTLRSKNIAIESSDGSVIKTGSTLILRGDEQQAVDASFLIQRHIANNREYIKVELTGLKRMGQDVSNPIDIQRYTVGLFNVLMDAIAPTPAPVPPASDADKASDSEAK